MRNVFNIFFSGLALIMCLFSPLAFAGANGVPILAYHNFDPSVAGSMTMSTARFEEQLKWIKDNGYTVIPLKDLVAYLQGKKSSLPEKSVVITADDGRKSVYQYMLPLVKKYDVPVTLFVYPSSISNASYAMTWDQLRELQKTGLFDVQGHTYWHPNFKQEKKRLGTAEYQKLVDAQLIKSKKVIDEKLGTDINLLAWPYGIYDEYLEHEANKDGYVMAFSIDGRLANKSENMMSQPRYMIVASQSMKAFADIVSGRDQGKKKH